MKHILGITIVICLMFFGCKSQDTSVKVSNKTKNTLVNNKWVLTQLEGKTVNVVNPFLTQPFLQFNKNEQSISGNGSCNSFTGKYTLNNQSVLFMDIATTLKYCDDHFIESGFLANLKRTTSYTIVNNVLHLQDKDNKILASFRPVKK